VFTFQEIGFGVRKLCFRHAFQEIALGVRKLCFRHAFRELCSCAFRRAQPREMKAAAETAALQSYSGSNPSASTV